MATEMGLRQKEGRGPRRERETMPAPRRKLPTHLGLQGRLQTADGVREADMNGAVAGVRRGGEGLSAGKRLSREGALLPEGLTKAGRQARVPARGK